MKGAEAVLACLRAEGIKYIFGNPGTTEIPLLDALCGAPDITYLVTLQEGIAIGMADGYTRSGGGIGFVSVHTAAGTFNTMGGLYSAMVEQSPIVLTAGAKDTRLLGRDCFSEVPDFLGITRQFTKWSWQLLRADKVVEDLQRAFNKAAAPPCGPVFMALPEDLLDQEVDCGEVRSLRPREESFRCTGNEEAILGAARLLVQARTPLFIAGREIARSNAMKEAVELADLLGLVVVTEARNSQSTLNFPHRHPAFRGPFLPALPAVKKADVVLGIGCRMFVQAGYAPQPDIPAAAKIIHFHPDAREFARLYREEISVLTDARQGMRALIAAVKTLLTDEVKKTVAGRKAALAKEKEEEERIKEEEIRAAWDKSPVQLPRLVREMRRTLAEDAIIVDEGIRSSRALLRYYDFDTPGTYYRATSGVLGWGMPAAMGVKLANPDRQVVAFVGDGSFMFAVQSLWTAARFNIAIVVVICNNRLYKAVKDACVSYNGIGARTGAFVATDINSPAIDFCQVASGFGVWAKRVSASEEIQPFLKEALALGKPAVLEVKLV